MNGARDYVLGLGSNLGSRVALLRAAIARLQTTAACELTAQSSVLETEPIGPPQPRYLNMVVRVRTAHEPDALWRAIASIEDALGRTREVRWGPRTIDIDVLWAPEAVDTASLRVPHRALSQRWFALAGLLEVAPELADHYGPALRELHAGPRRGIALEAMTRLQAQMRGDRCHVHLQAPDRVDTLAQIGTALAGYGTPREVRVAQVTCAPGEEARAIVEALRAHVAAGFAVSAAPIVSLQPGHAVLRVLGSPAPPRALPALCEHHERSTGSDCALELVFSAAVPAA